GIDTELRPRLGKENAVRIGKEIADAGVAQQLIDPLDVTALRQPDPLRPAAKVPLKLARADLDLGSHGVAVDVHQRQEAVRGATRNQLQLAGFEEAAETVEQIVAILRDKHLARPTEAIMIHPGQSVELGLPARSLDLLAGERDQIVKVP